jgi:lysozyme family protein
VSGFDSAFEKVVAVEGDYSNNATDHGGATKYGITERVARANGYDGQMQELPYSTAKAIYKRQYWDVLRLDDIAKLSFLIACELFDTSVNMGVGTAGTFLQRALNVLNRRGKDYADLKVDGVVGPVSVDDLRAFLMKRGAQGEVVMLRALNCLQGARYIEIAERDETQEDFEFGWLLNRVAMA